MEGGEFAPLIPKFTHSFHGGSGKEENMRIEQTKASGIATSIQKMDQLRHQPKIIIREDGFKGSPNAGNGYDKKSSGMDLRTRELLEDLRLEQNELH